MLAVIPTTLDQWTEHSILALLALGYYETEFFDFKETLPHKNDEVGKERLKAACCAFANSSGGFLVFGVKNDSSQASSDRVVGLSPSRDFPEQFGNYPAACEPSVLWTPKNPPIRLASGNLVHVVQILRSWRAPHCFDVSASVAKRFPKRTHKGTEDMSYEEIRMMFLQYYEKRVKLQLLRSELEGIKRGTYRLTVPEQELGTRDPPVGEFRLAVIESVLADTYSILAQETLLLTQLDTIRTLCSRVNEKMERWAPIAYLAMMERERLVEQHNRFVNNQCIHIRQCCDDVMRMLDEFLTKA